MATHKEDKLTERARYDERARSLIVSENITLGPNGAAGVALVLRQPYSVYEDFIRRSARPGTSVLDVCCGTGLFSLIAAESGANITASDIAENNLTLTRLRAERSGFSIKTVIADAEQLPFRDECFDLITCAGSLSYLNLEGFLAEVQRLLRPGGWFVCVDSLNHNPIYRFNRHLQYLRGQRTKSTLVRMPTMGTIGVLRQKFEMCEISFHGTASFLSPVLRPFLGEKRTAIALDQFDSHIPITHRWAFKFVLRGRRKET